MSLRKLLKESPAYICNAFLPKSKIPRLRHLLFLCLLISAGSFLRGCGNEEPEGPAGPPQPEYDWVQSEFGSEIFPPPGVLMEMTYETYGIEDKVVSYILTNTTMAPISFNDAVSLEHYQDGEWLSIPLTPPEPEPGSGPGSEAETGLDEASELQDESHELQGMQMCRVDLDISLLGMPFPEGRYRVVAIVEDKPCAAEYSLASERIDAKRMDFGYEPLASLPDDFDAVDAVTEGYYTITEKGPVNPEVVQRFADKVSLKAPAKLRTVLPAEDGGIIIRDIVFDLSPDGNGRFFVTVDSSRTSGGLTDTEEVYSFMSIARVGNKNKVCLSNYVSYSDYAPIGSALELISPEAPDNIDLVATVGLRTENNMVDLPYSFLAFGPDNISFVTISRGGDSFSVKSGDIDKTDIPPGEEGVVLTGARFLSETQISLSGFKGEDQSYQMLYELENDPEPPEPPAL